MRVLTFLASSVMVLAFISSCSKPCEKINLATVDDDIEMVNQKLQPILNNSPEVMNPNEIWYYYYVDSVDYVEDKSDAKVWKIAPEDMTPFKYGMYEFTQYPNQQPTEEHHRSANKLVSKAWNSAKEKGWLDKKIALANGFGEMLNDPIHFINKEHLLDGVSLDPNRPEVLMYYDTTYGPILMGVMFVHLNGHGEQIAGPLSLWHHHIEFNVCYEEGFPVGHTNRMGICLQGKQRDYSPEMMHVWFFNHPEGQFATKMFLPEEYFFSAVDEVKKRYAAAGIELKKSVKLEAIENRNIIIHQH